MKKITLTLVAVLFTVSMFANNDLKISFCDNDASKIEKQQLLDCNEFLVNSDEWEVKSLTIPLIRSTL